MTMRNLDDVDPTLFVVVDTEEEFDWSKPYDRANTSVRAMRHLHRGHEVLRRYGITPTYVVDYPVVTKPPGIESLRELIARDECTIGAHLHPWVTPPYDARVDRTSSFACNLGYPRELAKLATLTNAIRDNLGVRPRVYKAGRYGFGPSTIRVLEALGYEVDTSIQPLTDFSSEGGPSFLEYDASPFWFGRSSTLLELPCTTGYAGAAGTAARQVIDWGERYHRLRLPGILARLRLAAKLRLTPEGYTSGEHRWLTRALLKRGVRAFTLTFHSPSLEPGNTPYVNSRRELEEFLARIDRYCDFFFSKIGGRTMTPTEFRASMLGQPGREGPISAAM